MKKLLFAGIFLTLAAGLGFSQENLMHPKIKEVFEALDANFKKYPFAHLVAINKYDDDRMPRDPIKQYQRFEYTSEILDKDGNPMQGEIVYLQIIKNGYRYELKIDFLPGKEKNAKDIKTVRGQVLRIIRDLPEASLLLQPAE